MNMDLPFLTVYSFLLQDRKMDYSGMSGIPLIAREPTGAGAAVMPGKRATKTTHSVSHSISCKVNCEFEQKTPLCIHWRS